MYEKRELKNKLTWSKSRHEMFQNCKRMYYYNYYGSWGGWNYETNHPIRDLYVMKKLSPIPMWIGESVHENIAWAMFRVFNWGKPANFEQLKTRLRKYMKYEWWVSQQRYYLTDPSGSFGLAEHYYDEPINKIDFEKAYSHAEKSLENFFDNSIYNQFLGAKSIELIKGEERSSTKINGIQVWVTCDAILRWEDDFIIIDWKTGKKFDKDSYELQLSTYAIYLMKEISKQTKMNIYPSDIRVILSNVFLGEEYTSPVEIEKIQWAEKEIMTSVSYMKKLLRNPYENIAHIDDFPMTNNQDLCKYCNFRKACDFPM